MQARQAIPGARIIFIRRRGIIGLVPSFDSLKDMVPSPETFTGVKAVLEHGGDVDLDALSDHRADGTSSNVYGGGGSQEAAFDPSPLAGTRKELTDLDVAGLSDIGWEIASVPEPSSGLFALMGPGLLFFRRR